MTFSVTILGSNSAIPANGRYPSAQILNVAEELFLIDCGEGTQMRMNDFQIKRSKINQIFISHFHGDHIFGLPGLLTSYSLLGRQTPLEIYAPPGLQEMLHIILETSGSHLAYELKIHAIDPNNHRLIFQNNRIKVYTIPLEHRIPTCGFLFVEKPHERNIRPEKIKAYQIPFSKIREIKNGEDLILGNGEKVPNDELTFPPRKSRSYAYCSDTAYSETIIPIIKNTDLLYHEATFGSELEKLAKPRGHSTATEAATIAKKAVVGKLLIGHFSTRYKDLEPLLKEAKSVFENTEIATEGKTFDLSDSQIITC